MRIHIQENGTPITVDEQDVESYIHLGGNVDRLEGPDRNIKTKIRIKKARIVHCRTKKCIQAKIKLKPVPNLEYLIDHRLL